MSSAERIKTARCKGGSAPSAGSSQLTPRSIKSSISAALRGLLGWWPARAKPKSVWCGATQRLRVRRVWIRFSDGCQVGAKDLRRNGDDRLDDFFAWHIRRVDTHNNQEFAGLLSKAKAKASHEDQHKNHDGFYDPFIHDVPPFGGNQSCLETQPFHARVRVISWAVISRSGSACSARRISSALSSVAVCMDSALAQCVGPGNLPPRRSARVRFSNCIPSLCVMSLAVFRSVQITVHSETVCASSATYRREA